MPDTYECDAYDARSELLFGREALERLADSVVVVYGLGGVGSSCVEALARGGVGGLVLVDRDVVEPSNINRQAIAFRSTLGREKTDVMRDMVADIRPRTRMRTCHMFVTCDNAHVPLDVALEELGRVDYVVDAIDTIAQKLAIALIAQQRGLRHISCMGAANRLHPETLAFADLFDTSVCPMCAAVRREARKLGIDHMDVLYSPERPKKPRVDADAGEGNPPTRKAPLGTASFFPPIMGQMIAGKVIRELAGVEEDQP